MHNFDLAKNGHLHAVRSLCNYMKKTNLKITILLFCNLLFSCREETLEIIVLPGLGLAVNNSDTIKLGITTEKRISEIFGYRDTTTVTDIGSACGFDENGESVSWDSFRRQVHHNGIIFNFHSFIKDSLFLEKIEITEKTDYQVKINDSIILGKVVSNVDRYFPKRYEHDESTAYSFELNSYGIEFGLKDTISGKKLSYIAIFQASNIDE